MQPATPIIIVGMNRSGTKWLSNLLCNHPDVAGIQTPIHTGVLETNLFGNMQRVFGDLNAIDNYIAFIEAWSQTDFFKASGCARERFYEEPRPRTYLDAFRLLMDDMAARRGARFWLQKASPLVARDVVSSLGACRVVSLHRDQEPTLRSTIQLARATQASDSLLRAAFHYVYQDKLLAELERDFDALPIHYEDLQRDPTEALGVVCRHVGIDFRPAMLAEKFARNTSFKDVTPDGVLSEADLATLRAVTALLRPVPTGALGWLWRRLRGRSPHLVRGTYAEIEHRYKLR